jgi:UDP-N-acetylmuramoyl-L-alanyl-D-glutamate--2,6-diaminopimelate ligase
MEATMSASLPSAQPVSLRTLFPQAVFIGVTDIAVSRYCVDANKCMDGDVYIAGFDGISSTPDSVELAVRRGAVAVISENLLPVSIPQCLVPDCRQAFASISHEVQGRPSQDVLLVGVLGTHGKTTTCLMIASMLKKFAGRVAYKTSLGTSDGKDSTPSAKPLNSAENICRWLRRAIANKTAPAVIEISDRMLRDRSISALQFDVLILPSLRPSQRSTRFEARNYERAVRQACSQLKEHGIVIFNADDANLNRWVEKQKLPCLSYGMNAEAQVKGKRISQNIGEQTLMISAGQCLMPVSTKLIGDHNARHALAAVATGYAFGLELREVIPGITNLQKLPGRMEPVCCGQPFSVYVDVADQADRLAVALHALARQGGGPITCVAEVPESANAEARAQFGRVLERSGVKVILTQCRQTRVRGQRAMWEVLDGCERPAAIHVVPNRATGIELAIRSARPGEQILLAGWGANSWTAGEDRTVRTDVTFSQTMLRELPVAEPALQQAEVGPKFQIVRN